MPPSKPVTDFTQLPALPEGSELADSHCHLDMGFEDDLESVIDRARARGVRHFVTIGAGGAVERNYEAVRIAQAHDDVVATVGVHPHDAKAVTEAVLDQIERLARDPKVVAIGETGLDFHYDNSPRDVQEKAFRRFVQLARSLKLPIVVHLREADEAAVRILREEHASEVGGVIHCFSSDEKAARSFLDLGFHLSFSGIVTFPSAEPIRAAARLTPSDRILVETDAPFLAPIPFRGRRNEPSLVVQTAKTVADVRGEPLETFASNVSRNTRALFRPR